MEIFNQTWGGAVKAAQDKLYTELPETAKAVAKDLPPETAFQLGYETAIFDILRARESDPLEVEIVQVPLPFTSFPDVTTEKTND